MHDETAFAGHFVFGDCVLTSEGVLSRAGQERRLPPKETGVLLALVRSAGQLLTKNELLDAVWGDEPVGEESLTRCIYTLRRVLGETRSERYIDTVYGKGFRFTPKVIVMPDVAARKTVTLAILPFRTSGLDAELLQAELTHQASRLSHYGLTIIPAVMCRDATSATAIVDLIRTVAPDYYLTGETVQRGPDAHLVLDLVRSSDHALVSSHRLLLSANGREAELVQRIVAELPGQIPGFVPGRALGAEAASLDVMTAYQQGRRHLRHPSRQNLDHALHYFQMSLAADPAYVPAWCGLAETWLALATLGYLHAGHTLSRARLALDAAERHEPFHPLLLAVKAWYLGFACGEAAMADSLFETALALASRLPEIHYYHACHLYHARRFQEAAEALASCLTIDPGMTVARTLQLWVLYQQGRLDEGRASGDAALATSLESDPFLCAALAVISLEQGDEAWALALAGRMNVATENARWLTACHAWVTASLDPDAVAGLLPEWLRQAGQEPLMLSIYLPVVRLVQGEAAARALALQAGQTGCLWLPMMRADRRVATLSLSGSDDSRSSLPPQKPLNSEASL